MTGLNVHGAETDSWDGYNVGFISIWGRGPPRRHSETLCTWVHKSSMSRQLYFLFCATANEEWKTKKCSSAPSCRACLGQIEREIAPLHTCARAPEPSCDGATSSAGEKARAGPCLTFGGDSSKTSPAQLRPSLVCSTRVDGLPAGHMAWDTSVAGSLSS